VRAGILCTTIVCTLMFPFTTLLPVFARDLLGVGAEGRGCCSPRWASARW
jgi:hypothetical protein